MVSATAKRTEETVKDLGQNSWFLGYLVMVRLFSTNWND